MDILLLSPDHFMWLPLTNPGPHWRHNHRPSRGGGSCSSIFFG